MTPRQNRQPASCRLSKNQHKFVKEDNGWQLPPRNLAVSESGEVIRLYGCQPNLLEALPFGSLFAGFQQPAPDPMPLEVGVHSDAKNLRQHRGVRMMCGAPDNLAIWRTCHNKLGYPGLYFDHRLLEEAGVVSVRSKHLNDGGKVWFACAFYRKLAAHTATFQASPMSLRAVT